MPGRALEIALECGDIGRSFEAWTRFGFGHALTTDTWSHPYGVVTAARLNIGLHATSLRWPLLTLTRPDIVGLVPLLEERGVTPEDLRLGSEVFNELQFEDPAGLRVRVIEARTFSPPAGAGDCLLGRFDALSWPSADVDAVATFWQRLHVEPRVPDRRGLGGAACRHRRPLGCLALAAREQRARAGVPPW